MLIGVGLVFCGCRLNRVAADADPPPRAAVPLVVAAQTNAHSTADPAATGKHLFLQNCAHCHGIDATGDEGPDLHDVHKSDDALMSLIKNGKKGEMPAFGRKLTDADVAALIAFVRSIQE